jgi:hypothetical protein
MERAHISVRPVMTLLEAMPCAFPTLCHVNILMAAICRDCSHIVSFIVAKRLGFAEVFARVAWLAALRVDFGRLLVGILALSGTVFRFGGMADRAHEILLIWAWLIAALLKYLWWYVARRMFV